MMQRRFGQERQIARDDEPRSLRMRFERGVDAGDRTVAALIGDHRILRADRIFALVGANRNKRRDAMLREQLIRPLELWLAVIRERCFVALHATALAAGEHETEERW